MTITIGDLQLQSAIDVEGNTNNNKVLLYAYLNAVYETGFTNPIDKAIKDFCSDRFDIIGYSKLDEIPYDFIRKRLSIMVSSSGKTTKTLKHFVITKGALNNILKYALLQKYLMEYL